MKQKGLFFLILLALTACQSAQNTVREAKLNTDPKKVELFVNQQTDPYTIRVHYSVVIPDGFVPQRGQLTYTPRIVAPGYEYSLSPFVISGDKYPVLPMTPLQKELSRIHYLTSNGEALPITVDETVPFELWMLRSKLIATMQLKERGRLLQLPSQTLAEGVIYIPQGPGPVRVKYLQKEVFVPHRDSAVFYYPTNQYSLQPDYKDNAVQLKYLREVFQKIARDTSAVAERIVITGLCSPDGSPAYNQVLAQKRAADLLRYLQSTENLEAYSTELKTVAQDWEGLKRLLPQLPATEQAIVSAYLRERKENNGKAGKFLREEVFPLLQKVVCEIYYQTRETQTIVEPE